MKVITSSVCNVVRPKKKNLKKGAAVAQISSSHTHTCACLRVKQVSGCPLIDFAVLCNVSTDGQG